MAVAVLIKLYLQSQVVGRILPTPVLDGCMCLLLGRTVGVDEYGFSCRKNKFISYLIMGRRLLMADVRKKKCIKEKRAK